MEILPPTSSDVGVVVIGESGLISCVNVSKSVGAFSGTMIGPHK